jgi:hypothetical protein
MNRNYRIFKLALLLLFCGITYGCGSCKGGRCSMVNQKSSNSLLALTEDTAKCESLNNINTYSSLYSNKSNKYA